MGTSPQVIEKQLEYILSSENFENSPRLSALLSYLVNATLSGNGDTLKGYSIGVDVFDRPDDFDPQLDSIVRVQAGRLRQQLKMYYLTTGQKDRVRIDIPKGSYTPVFIENSDRNESITEEVSPPVESTLIEKVQPALPRKSRTVFRRAYIWPALLGFALLFTGLLFNFYNSRTNTNDFISALEFPSGPSITVLPFKVQPSDNTMNIDPNAASLRTGLQFALVNRLSKFKDMMVVSVGEVNVKSHSINARTEEIKTDYILSGIIQTNDNRVQVTSTLSSMPNGAIIWSRFYDEPLITSSGILKIQAKVSQDVATTLGQPYSTLNRTYPDLAKKYQNADIKNYYCLSRFYAYVKKKEIEEHKYIRDCLENAVKLHPEFSTGWAALSWVYGDETRNNFNLREDEAPPYERALNAAREAVAANPQNGTAHQYLAMARYMNDDIIGFRSSAKRALELNPNDTEILADIGSYLLLLDNSEEGRYMVEKAIMLNPGHPEWYHGSIFMYFYTRGQSEQALFHARQFSSDQSLLSQLGLTVTLIQSGDLVAGLQQFEKLKALYPNFVNSYDAELDNMRLPKGMKNQVLNDLKRAGLGQ